MSLLQLPVWIPGMLLGILAFEGWITLRRVLHLQQLPEAPEGKDLPPLCICIPARNEALEVGSALDSWLDQDYPGLRIVVVDDGSTDGTSELLEARVARAPGRLRVIRNEVLPPGWLGKNHAVHLATQQPEAQEAPWLLFADADMHASPELLRRVFAFLQAHPADFMALWPAMRTDSFWERLAIPMAALFILWAVPTRRVTNPKSRFAFGAGAFTLVRREAYQSIGGHAAARLEPIDDVGLALRLKWAGFRNQLAAPGPALQYRPAHGFRAEVPYRL